MNISRRQCLQFAALSASGISTTAFTASDQHVVVIGAGFAGTTVTKYLRKFGPQLRITLIEPNDDLIMCPLSMRVIHGGVTLADISRPYAPFVARYHINWVKGVAETVDVAAKLVLVGKEKIAYDHLVVAPGVDFNYEGIVGLQSESARSKVPHAWRAGLQTLQLRGMLQRLNPGGVVAVHIPKGGMRARPAAYERISLIASMLKQVNPRAKILAFDAGAEPPFANGVVLGAWQEHYGSMIDYQPNAEVERVDADLMAISLKGMGTHKAHALNLIPPQRANSLAQRMGLTGADKLWCPVDFLTMESGIHKGIYVLGDAVAGITGMPKSGQMANQQAKVCAAAITAATSGQPVPAAPIMISAGYTYITPNHALAASAVYRYSTEKRTMVAAKDAGGSSTEASPEHGLYAMSWATNILNDMMG
jgi:sulfide dehydrogenase [flavocytochrome c] flavoprotein subunit